MNNKKKQTAAVAMATVLSVSTVVNPVTVRAQENEPPVTQGIQQENGQQEAGKETAPAITLPENLQAAAGTPLKEIGLPENWTWADESTVLSADTTTYPAYVTVDDETYDYAETEGYHAEGHYVEVQLSVTVETLEEKTEEEPAPAPILKNPLSRAAIPTPYDVGDVAINETNFPDEAFRNYIKMNFDKDSNDTLSAAEIASVTTISAPREVANLTGIDKFSALTTLYCSGTGITSLDVSNNDKLKTLYCQSTGISSLDVSNNTNLTYLNCQSTGITSLDVSNNDKLETLYCQSNKTLTTLNVDGASALKTLNCYGTGISSLDVSSNTNLTYLNCQSTGISSLDVSSNPKLEELYCQSTGISSLDVSSNVNLEKLYCSSTGISSLDVSSNVNLEKLYCSSTGISSLDVSNNTNLTTLYCNSTGISSLDVSSNTNLTTLDCSLTPLAYLNLGTNAGLTVTMPTTRTMKLEVTEDTFTITDKIAGIDKSKISIVSGASYESSTGVVSNYTAGTPIVYEYDCGTANGEDKTLTVTVNLTGYSAGIEINETNFPDAAFRDYIKTNFDKDSNDTLSAAEIASVTTISVPREVADLTGIDKFSALTTLNCSGTGITSLDVSSNANLTTLYCNNTGISSLDVSSNANLTDLYCQSTGISSLDVSSNTALTTLNCYSNAELKTLNVNGASALKILSCSSTGISSLDVSRNANLTYLSCSSTGISSLDVSSNANLTTLNCYSNTALTTLTVNGASALTTLDCYSTGISSLDVSSNVNLTTLYCQETGISSLNVSSNANLTELYCNSNASLTTLTVNGASALKKLECNSTGISSLDVSNNTNLTTLYCNITGISSLDVSKNTNLTELYCNNTGITSLDVSKNTNLTELYCSSTGISSLDVSNNANLQSLHCSFTPLAYLNLGTNAGLTVTMPTTRTMELEVTEDTFTITDKITGIDKDKVSIISGASYESSTGVVSNYTAGTPIVYEYDCGTAKGENKTLTVTLNLTGLKAESSITVTETLDKTYDGSAVNDTPTVSKTGSTGIVTYTWEKKKNATDWESIASAPTDAGTYRVTATVAADDDYKKASSTPVEFTISKADSTISVTESLDKDYDGSAVNNTPTVSKSGSTGNVTYTWEKKKNATEWESIAAAPTDAGTYRVTATVAADDNYKKASSTPVEFTISKVDSTISVTESLNKDYDGSAVNSTPTVSKSGSTGNVTYTWEKKKNATEWESISSAPTDAGTYRVTATIAADNNYEEASSTPVEFTISKADSTISVTDSLNKDYDGSAVKDTPTVSKAGSTGNVTYTWEKKKNATDWESISSAPTDAGTYRVTATVAADDNYKKASSTPVEFTISQAANSWTSTLAITGWTYGQAANTPAAVAAFGSVSYTYSNQAAGTYTENVPTDAGTWYVKATVTGTDNFKGIESSAVEFTIAKADAPVMTLPDNLSGVYDEDLSSVTLPDGWAWADGTQKLTVSGTDYPAHFTVDDKNYDYTGVTGYDSTGHYVECMLSVIVSAAANSWTVEPAIENWTYNETASTPTADAAYGDVVISYSDTRNGTYTADRPATAGIWYMKASVSATTEYTGLDTIVEFTISQAEPVYTVPTDLQAVYGQSLKDITLPAGFTWTDQTLDVGNAGTNEFTLTYTPDDSNYKTVTDIKVTVTVTKADNEQSAPLSLNGWTYGAAPSAASAGFRFGQPRFLYSDRVDGTYTDTVPTAAGTWYVKAVVDGTDNYEGAESEAVSFVIEPKSAETGNQIKVPEMTADTKLDDMVIKDGDKVLVQGTDYDVTRTQDGNKVTVTITFKGNYTGTITKTYTVDDKKPSGNTDKDKNHPSDKEDTKNDSVQTGDTATTGLWAMLMAAAAGAAALLKGKKRKEDTEE